MIIGGDSHIKAGNKMWKKKKKGRKAKVCGRHDRAALTPKPMKPTQKTD